MGEEDPIVARVAEEASAKLGGMLDLSSTRWIARPAGKERIGDATLALYVDGVQPAHDVVLLISNPAFPETVCEDVARARTIAGRVRQSVARHIVTPVCEGRVAARSYAAFARLNPLSRHKGPRFVQKALAARRIVPWLADLAADTRVPAPDGAGYSKCFIDPLGALVEDPDLSAPLRRFAEYSRDRVAADRPDLFTAVQHGDFWLGNVLFDRRAFAALRPSPGVFRVIDWRGARTDGYPCMDLARLCISLYGPRSTRSRGLVQRYRTALNLSEAEIGVYCLLSLGQLEAHRDQLPKERYVKMCETTFDFLGTHLATARQPGLQGPGAAPV